VKLTRGCKIQSFPGMEARGLGQNSTSSDDKVLVFERRPGPIPIPPFPPDPKQMLVRECQHHRRGRLRVGLRNSKVAPACADAGVGQLHRIRHPTRKGLQTWNSTAARAIRRARRHHPHARRGKRCTVSDHPQCSDSQPGAARDRPPVRAREYLKAMGIPLLEGRFSTSMIERQ
jgi:hypothetical protein